MGESTSCPAGGLAEVTTLASLAELVVNTPGLYVPWSTGPETDRAERSTDYVTGLELPGLAVYPLTPPTGWTLPVEVWVGSPGQGRTRISVTISRTTSPGC
jgi:hypothetical protein